jgi:hypothetical protein
MRGADACRRPGARSSADRDGPRPRSSPRARAGAIRAPAKSSYTGPGTELFAACDVELVTIGHADERVRGLE